MGLDLVIRGGTLVTPAETFVADIGIAGGRIACLGRGLHAPRTIDAGGRLVIPGAIDPHVHLQMDAGPIRTSDDWESGTIAAACGGTTTVIDFVEPERGQSMSEGLAARRLQADAGAVIDYGLHMTIRPADIQTLQEIPAVVAAGCPSFKTYLTYEGLWLDDASLLRACQAVRGAGGIVLVHAENHAAIGYLTQKLVAAGETSPRAHPRSRPPVVEAGAIEHALMLAEIAECPVYVVHVSTARGVEAVRAARRRGQAAFGETCPHYLLLTDREYERPGFEGAQFVCSPPLRPAGNPPALWDGLASGDLQTVGTDHCSFLYQGQKDLGRGSFVDIPNGMPGIESRLALLYTFGVGQGRISLNRWVQVCCAAPAQLFGLYPQKGALVPGADADLVIFDPDAEVTLSTAILHERVDYTPYAGLRLHGYPAMTIAGGQVICENGKFAGGRRGQFLARRLR
jgi:dihydropyrimidinase